MDRGDECHFILHLLSGSCPVLKGVTLSSQEAAEDQKQGAKKYCFLPSSPVLGIFFNVNRSFTNVFHFSQNNLGFPLKKSKP